MTHTDLSIGEPRPYPVDDAEDDHPTTRSPLAGLKAKIEKAVIEPLILVHPVLNGENGTDRWEMVFPRDIPDIESQMARWRRVTGKIKDENARAAKFNALVVGDTCTEMRRNGVLATDSAGDPVNFQNRELQAELEVSTAADAVREFIPKTRAGALAGQILHAAGVGVELEEGQDEVTPTSGG